MGLFFYIPLYLFIFFFSMKVVDSIILLNKEKNVFLNGSTHCFSMKAMEKSNRQNPQAANRKLLWSQKLLLQDWISVLG